MTEVIRVLADIICDTCEYRTEEKYDYGPYGTYGCKTPKEWKLVDDRGWCEKWQRKQ